MGGSLELAIAVLIPSWKELNLSLVAAVLLVLLYGLLQQALFPDHKGVECRNHGVACRRNQSPASSLSSIVLDSENLRLLPLPSKPSLRLMGGDMKYLATKEISDSPQTDLGTCQTPSSSLYVVRLELLAAKNLAATNINGTADPYAVLTCGSQKRFSSVVPGSRNPMWGEEFEFYTDELPVNVTITIHDWDIVWKSATLGTVTITVSHAGLSEADWHPLDKVQGQVCIQTNTRLASNTSSAGLGGLGLVSRRRISQECQVATEVRQKPGPLQTIFGLPPDEVVIHSYSCALERSFLYHGRMYVSAYNICFRSNIFAKGLKIVLSYDDISEIRKSQHAFINPAITVVLRAGAGGHGVPPLADPDGRAKYKFASFWNRNHVYRVLLRQFKAFQEMEAAAAQEEHQSQIRAQSCESLARNAADIKANMAEDVLERALTPPRSPTPQPFLNDINMSDIMQTDLPCTADEYFRIIWHDDSDFTATYRGARKDTDLKVEPWNVTELYGGLIHKATFRSLCHSPMCPPDTAMTDWQHLAATRDQVVLESIQQAHDVPFGSYFEVQARWVIETNSSSSCSLHISAGTHFKKWCVMQSKIRSSAITEYKADCELFLRLAVEYIDKWKREQQLAKSPPVQLGRQKEQETKRTLEYGVELLDVVI